MEAGRRHHQRVRPVAPHVLQAVAALYRVSPATILDRRCDPPGELIRTFVKGCGGDWEHARRRLSAAHGDIARALVALKRTPQRAQVGQPASSNDPAAVRDYRARQRGG